MYLTVRSNYAKVSPNELYRERNVAVFESPQNFAGYELPDPYKGSFLPYMGKMTRRSSKNCRRGELNYSNLSRENPDQVHT